MVIVDLSKINRSDFLNRLLMYHCRCAICFFFIVLLIYAMSGSDYTITAVPTVLRISYIKDIPQNRLTEVYYLENPLF